MAWAVSAISPTWPGTTETPAFRANFLLSILSPIAAMAFTGGPMNAIPSAASASAKLVRSDRNPYPGCTASSAMSTNGLRASASE